MFLAMPAAMRIWASVESNVPCPVTVREGRNFLQDFAAQHSLRLLPPEPKQPAREPVITVENAWFRYEQDSPDVVKGLDLMLGKGEFLTLLGGNGAGKSTILKLLSGLKKPYRGEIRVSGTLAMLPQNPQALFVKKTVREDLFEIFSGSELPKAQQEERVSRMVQLVGDDRTSSALFGMMLCITQVLVAPLAWYAGSWIVPLENRAQLRPLVYIASIAVVCLLLWLRRRTLRTRTVAKGPTWGCGFTAPNVRMQYTGESFSEGLQSIATSLTQNSGQGSPVGKGEIFPAAHSFDIGHRDRIGRLFAAWWVELLRVINQRVMRLRTGKINHYILFALAFLGLVFLLSVFNAI